MHPGSPSEAVRGILAVLATKMAKNRSVKPAISETAQDEIKGIATEVARKTKEILERMNAEMKEFKKRRVRVREKIESGARKTTGRIV
jgi:hypothetical protein